MKTIEIYLTRENEPNDLGALFLSYESSVIPNIGEEIAFDDGDYKNDSLSYFIVVGKYHKVNRYGLIKIVLSVNKI